jgi:hypothetical protein
MLLFQWLYINRFRKIFGKEDKNCRGKQFDAKQKPYRRLQSLEM